MAAGAAARRAACAAGACPAAGNSRAAIPTAPAPRLCTNERRFMVSPVKWLPIALPAGPDLELQGAGEASHRVDLAKVRGAERRDGSVEERVIEDVEHV